MATWLVIATERLELEGILKRSGNRRAPGPADFDFACEISRNGDGWMLIANGPGGKLVGEVLRNMVNVDGVISTGFCGALDPSLRVGDIVMDSAANRPRQWAGPAVRVGKVVCADQVAVTSAQKRILREQTGGIAVEMESATVAEWAGKRGVPFYSIRAVSDTAEEDMPLDFNLYRDRAGRFSRGRIALAALARPFSAVPALLRLNRHCRMASESLGEFFADCRF